MKIGRFIALLKIARKTKEPGDLSRGFRCLAADVIVDYANREDFGGLGAEGFKHPLIEAGDTVLINAQWGLYFRTFFTSLDYIASWLPGKVLSVIAPQLLAIKNFEMASSILTKIRSYTRPCQLSHVFRCLY